MGTRKSEASTPLRTRKSGPVPVQHSVPESLGPVQHSVPEGMAHLEHSPVHAFRTWTAHGA
eukprot:3851726-Rhodomonas_salina.1